MQILTSSTYRPRQHKRPRTRSPLEGAICQHVVNKVYYLLHRSDERTSSLWSHRLVLFPWIVARGEPRLPPPPPPRRRTTTVIMASNNAWRTTGFQRLRGLHGRGAIDTGASTTGRTISCTSVYMSHHRVTPWSGLAVESCSCLLATSSSNRTVLSKLTG